MTTQQVKWNLEADYFQACNCDYGCPCEFEAPPTQGYCEGVGAWRINRGSYGNVSLDGLGFAFAARWPGPIHQGNGTVALFFDERANQQQRDALMNIATGQAGGIPFEIIVTTFTNVLDPQYVPFQFNVKGRESSVRVGNGISMAFVKGRESSVRVGNGISMAFEPVKNPVTGEPEGIRIEHETGFIFKGADVVSARECRESVGELDFSWPNKAGFVTQIRYGN